MKHTIARLIGEIIGDLNDPFAKMIALSLVFEK